MSQRKVVHIHNHSIYSIADSSAKPEELAKRASELGIDTICITDHGNISGVIQMKKACEKYNIKFIPGCEMYEALDRTNKLVELEDDHDAGKTVPWSKNHHITMLPVNNEGWNALQFLIADANENGFYKKPRTDMKFIAENNLGKNIIATSGCLGGVIAAMIMSGDYDAAKAEAMRRTQIFHSFYLEVQDNGSREQDILNMELVRMSKETGIPLVYAKDVHYVHKEDAEAHHTLVAISRRQTIYECCPYPGTNTYHLADADEVYAWAKKNKIPTEAIENTVKIAELCDVKIELGKDLMPDYEYCEEGHTPETYLQKLLHDNLIEYVAKKADRQEEIDLRAYLERIQSEYQVIIMKGFPSYFLILWDILLWATHRKKWKSYPANAKWLLEPDNQKYEFYPQYIIGPGRGSAAGSLMAFLLGITKLDPIEYGLLFQRFLNPYRNGMPDIDCDFSGDNHDLLLDFVAQRYHRDRTAQILTFTKFKLRSSIDKICKALEKRDPNNPKKILEYGYAVADEIKKILDMVGDKMPDQSDLTYKVMMDICEHPEKYSDFDTALPRCIEASREFRKMMNQYPELHKRLEKVEGCIDSSSIHAGGVIISKRPLKLDCPTILPNEKSKAILPITMFDYPDAEQIGLLKMDLLRTSTLKIIEQCVDIIEQTHGKVIDVYEIGRDDPQTFETIARGETHGLFQVNGGGITGYTRQVNPTKQSEIIDILGLYRPGPLDALLDNGNTIAQQYVINGSRKPKEYLKEVHPKLRSVLKKTRGQFIYQEQLMEIVQLIAGYNLGHADNFRRVISKKKISEMKKLYDEFVYGHKYVIKKWEKYLKKLEESGKDTIEVKSNYDGNKSEMNKAEIESELKSAKKAMDAFEVKGAVALGCDEKFARSLFHQIAAFAGYSFNRSHSACYADETYQTAWLKTHYPVEFMTALLTVRAEGSDAKAKTLDNLKEAKRMGIKILPPNINQSDRGFQPEGDGIRFGLLSIDGLGVGAVDAIIKIRNDGGPFKSFDDLLERSSYKGCPINRGVYRTLIRAGCFDVFEPNRYKLLNYYNFTIRKDKRWEGSEEELEKPGNKAKSNHSMYYEASHFTEKMMLEMERQLIGMYVSGSPYDGLPFTSLTDMQVSTRRDKTYYEIGGRISKIKTINARTGKMAFITLETQLEPFEATVFPGDYDNLQQHLYTDNIVVIRGYKNMSYYKGEEKEQFIAEKILLKQAKQLKKELGVKDKKTAGLMDDSELPILAQSEGKLKPKADPVADLFEGKKKKKSKKLNPKDYLSDEEEFVI